MASKGSVKEKKRKLNEEDVHKGPTKGFNGHDEIENRSSEGVVKKAEKVCKQTNGHCAEERSEDQGIDQNAIDDDYFRCYADIKIHEDMLNDTARTLAYKEALLTNKGKLLGATVLDVGAGTGILSHFAVQAGAAKVYAVEPTRIARFAKQICKENGTESSISIIQSKIEDTSISEKVDAIVSEWMGYCLLYESMLPSVLWARDNYLKPEGDMYPCKATLFLAPINDEAIQERLSNWNRMKDLYGVSMTSLEPLSKDAITIRADSLHLDVESVLADASCLCDLDLKTVSVQEAQLVQENFHFKCFGRSVMHGFATWFSVTFPGGLKLDTSPSAEPTHWGQTVMYLREPIPVQQDTEIRGSYRMQPSTDNPRFWGISVEFEVDGGKTISQQWRCAD